MVFRIIVILIGIVVLSYIGISIYIASVLTIPGKSPLKFDKFKIGSDVKDVSFQSRDGLTLKGWLFNGTNKKVIMFVHGAGNQNRANEVYGTPDIAKFFLQKGYSILLFDLRGTGESQFARASFGQYESLDVAAGYGFLQTQGFKPSQIGILSDSLGAIATAMAATDIKDAGGIVLDSPAAAVRDIVSNIMVNEHNVPRFLHPGIFLAAKIFYKIDVDSVRPIDKISILANTPILFLHGENDTLIVPENSVQLLKKVNHGTRAVFPGTKHVEGFIKHPDLYKQLVEDFFEQNLKD